MHQFLLWVLNCSWEKLDGESVPATGQHLDIGSGLGGWAWGSSQPLTSSVFLGTQDMSWCLRCDSFSLISPHSAPSLLHTFFVFCLVAPLDVPSPPKMSSSLYSELRSAMTPQGLLRIPRVQPTPAPSQKPISSYSVQWKGLLFLI